MGSNRRSKRIVVAQRKGGVGKTTIAVSLAAELRGRGAEVALIDADPQGSASHWAALGCLGFPVHEIVLNASGNVTNWTLAVTRTNSNYSVIDTAPSDDALGASIALADVAIIPCLPSGLDLEATVRTMEIVNAVRMRRADNLQVILVPNRVDRRTLEGRQLIEELEQFGELIAPPLGNRYAFVRPFSIGHAVNMYQQDGADHRELAALCDLVEDCVGGSKLARANSR
jgi:chromosome partitioning protein